MKILIGVDDSIHSNAAVDFVRRMTWPRGSKVLVLSVVQALQIHDAVYAPAPLGPPGLETMDALMQRHQDIASTAERVLRLDIPDTQSSVAVGDPRTVLIETARSEHADLVVVGSHGRTGLAKLLIGSVASHVVTHAPCSVLVVKMNRR